MEHRVPPRVQPTIQPRSLKECSGRTARMATEDSGRPFGRRGAGKTALPRNACQRPRLRIGDAGARLPGGRMAGRSVICVTNVNSQAVYRHRPGPRAMLGLSLFGGGYGPVHQAEDHRCDGGGADGGGLGRPGSRVKENGATKDPNLTRAASKRPGQTGDGRASLQGLASGPRFRSREANARKLPLPRSRTCNRDAIPT
jgi:hypothetical protein